MSSVNVLRILAQFVTLPILSRLLTPTDYGIVGIAMPFILFAMMLADAGIGMSLVRTPAKEREEWSTCFWLSVVFGIVLAVIVIALAPLAALSFGEPTLTPIVTALAVVVGAQAVFLVPRAAQQQSHQFNVIAGTEMAAIACGIGCALVIALCGGGAWALVGQQLAFFAVRVVLTVWLSPFRPLMVFEFHRAREHIRFGRDLLNNNLIGFFTRSIDNLLIGKVLGSEAVGFYSMAFQFARLPMMLIAGPLQYVLYSELVKLKKHPLALGCTFFTLSRVLAILVFPTVGMVAAAHQAVFRVLLSDKWASSGHLFMIVAAACALQAVTSIGGTIRMVMGRTDILLRMTIESGVVWFITLLVAVRFGLDWIAVAYNISALVYFPRSMMLVLPVVGGSLPSYLRTIAIPFLVSCGCILGFRQVTRFIALSDWSQLCVGGAFAVIGVVACIFIQRQTLRVEIAALRKLMQSSHEE